MASSGSEGEDFEVQEVLDQRKKGRTVEYLVRWKGYGVGEDTWEPAKNLRDSQKAIDEFLHNQATGRRSTRGSAVTKVTKSTGGTATSRAVRKTTTVTKSSRAVSSLLQDTESESESSKEATPVATRQVLRTRTYQVTQRSSGGTQAKKGSSLALKSRAKNMMKFSRRDIPIFILVACLLVIAVSFVIEH